MGIFSYLALLVVAALAVILFLALRKPDTFKIERRAVIAAPPEVVFGQINDLVAWQAWSPWAKKDPDARQSFGATTAGVGAQFGWDGNKNVGKGAMTITHSMPGERVVFRLDFEKPFKATNIAEFALRPVGPGTEVIWEMTGRADFMFKVMDVLMGMDKMVGRDFEAGLGSLKAICEARA